MKKALTITNNQVEFLNFLKSKFPLFHLSNIFFRDIHYGVMEFLEKKNIKASYAEAEQIAREISTHLEKQNILRKVNQQGWVLLYPEFTAKKAS
jgi:hypothetical protein